MGRTGLIRLAVAVFACAAWCGAVEAQSVGASQAPSKSAATLFELIFGAPPADAKRPDEPRRLDPDRPHFPEATTTVGLNRVVLESGYTFTRKDASFTDSAPEALLRVGVLADWFELRAGQNFFAERRTVGGTTTSASGAQDLYLGAKLALAAQHGVLPAIALIPQMTVPTGSAGVTAGRVLPGFNADFGWEVIENRFGIELLVANNLVRDDVGAHHELATGLTGVVQLTRTLEAFVEWDAFYPTGGPGGLGPRHYAVGGLVYFVTPDVAVDIRAGVGLNDRSNDFIAGLGFALRR
jgi:Putative MetA-pathway of phenol degradation